MTREGAIMAPRRKTNTDNTTPVTLNVVEMQFYGDLKLDNVRVKNSGEETRKEGQREGTPMTSSMVREKDTTLAMRNEMANFISVSKRKRF